MNIHLDAATVFAVARKAYEAGELEAQTNPGYCTYIGPCAIGVAMPPEKRHHFSGGIDRLIWKGEVTTDNPDALVWLQKAHDTWSMYRQNGYFDLVVGDDLVDCTEDPEPRFKEILYAAL